MLFQLLFLSGSIFLIEGRIDYHINLAGNGSTAYQGRVEITRENVTGTVCKDSFNDLAASVVCRELGFQIGGEAVTDGRFGEGTGPIWLDDVTCTGNEDVIDNCIHQTWNQSDCLHNEDVGVICNVTSSTTTSTTSVPITKQPSNCSPDIRLVGPANLIGVGFVEVQRNGTWGSICDDMWGKQDAQVVCRMLCYDPTIAQAGAPIDIDVAKKDVSQNFVLDDVECNGNETDIDQCLASTEGKHNCESIQQEYASVTCIKLNNTRPPAPIPEMHCADGKFNIQFSLTQDPNLLEKHLSIPIPYTGACNMEKQTSNSMITVTIPYNECGTKPEVNATHLIYTNSIKYDYTVIQGQIVRVNTYNVEVCCIFPRDLDIYKGFSPLPETVKKKAPGNFSIIMTLYNDSFITSLNAPVDLILGEWLNVALQLEDTEGHPDLKLIVPDCKATPTDSPNDPIYFTLFSNKCAEDPTLGFFPLNSTTFGFRYQTFKFHRFENVFIHCNAWVCLTAEKYNDCDRTCNTTNSIGRRKRDVSSRDIYALVSQPLNFKQYGDNSLIDRGDGWQVNLATTKPSITSTTHMRSTKPSNPVPSVTPIGTTNVMHVRSSTTIASFDTESATMKRTSTLLPRTKPQTLVKKSSTTKPTVSDSLTSRNWLASTTVKPIIPNNVKTKTSAFSPSYSPFMTENSILTMQKTSTTKFTISGSPLSQKGLSSTTINQTAKHNVETKTSTHSPSSSQTKMDIPAVSTPVKHIPEDTKHVLEPNKLYIGGLGGKLTILSHASRLHLSFHALVISTVFGILLVLC